MKDNKFHEGSDPAATNVVSGANEVAVDGRVLAEVAKVLAGLRYGSVEITVHDGKVTQIEAKKKIRLN